MLTLKPDLMTLCYLYPFFGHPLNPYLFFYRKSSRQTMTQGSTEDKRSSTQQTIECLASVLQAMAQEGCYATTQLEEVTGSGDMIGQAGSQNPQLDSATLGDLEFINDIIASERASSNHVIPIGQSAAATDSRFALNDSFAYKNISENNYICNSPESVDSLPYSMENACMPPMDNSCKQPPSYEEHMRRSFR